MSGPSAAKRAELGVDVITEFLGSTPLFAKCEPTVAGRVAPRVVAFEFPAQSSVLPAGAPAQWLGIVFRGKATVRVIDAATGESTIAEALRVGDHFGDVGAILGTAQPFGVQAEETCTVLAIPIEVVEQLCTKIPGFGHALARRLSTRLLQASLKGLRRGSGATPAMGVPQATPTPAPVARASVPPALGVIPFVKVSDYDLVAQVVAMVPPKVIQKHQLVPLRLSGKTLTVGMVDPRNVAALTDLRRVLHAVDPEVVAISSDDFAQTFLRLKLDVVASSDGRRPGAPSMAPDALTFDQVDVERDAEKNIRVIGEEVINLVNRILIAALDREASDVHVEPDAGGLRIRFRVHGLLVDWNELVPPSFSKSLVARLKILGGLDITERRLPQDGRIGMRAGRRELDIRVSTLPSSRGEKIVLRIFEAAAMMRPLDHVFLEPGTLASVRKALNRPHGAVIVAGPTGSGKSSTLYATLNERRRTRPDSNILMVEDPIEYRLTGVTQVQVSPAVGLGFPQVLRAMLRQDPDVVMVGEVRDEETAKMALEAAMTGHLLFTSMHANDAITAVQRFENLGCGRSLIAQSLALVLVQRLVRRLCPGCCRAEVPAPILFESLVARGLVDRSAQVPLPRAVGCDACGQTGYSGRIAVVETLQVTDEIRAGLMAGQHLAELARMATESRLLFTFARYASFLMARKVVGPSEALLAVAD
ncbi:MAG: Flp pilus assembly complex ATPase component TadA [Deltaproteobacteria bacterium]|nr:Flp pilus assembly complex ATPase component TadA [Deltaproteobacteria bacterium]